MADSTLTVGLFVTCIVDIMRPQIGFATIKLLEQSGCRVEVPSAQTCCGQPAYNSGDDKDTVSIAKQVLITFEKFDYVIAPSGSCAGMIKSYPDLFNNEHEWKSKAIALADKTYELTSFLVDIRKFKPNPLKINKSITYHDSCHGHNELRIYKQPRQLLESAGCKLKEMSNSTECCGFGGTFCVKYPDISNAMVSDKAKDINSSGAELLVGGDYGCLMNISGKLNREQSKVQSYHVAEILADMMEQEK